MGTPDPVWPLAASPTGRWIVVCQARADTNHDGTVSVARTPEGRLSGDDGVPYWIQGSGPGQRIEAWLGQSPDGRFVGLERGGRLEILDTATGRTIDMTARGMDGLADRLSHAEHRALSFSPDSRRLAFIRRREERGAVAVMDLETGEERELEVGGGRPWRVSFAADPNSVNLWLIKEDKNGNGRLDWPVPALPIGSTCRTDTQRYSAWLDHGDPATLEIVSIGNVRGSRSHQGIAALGAGFVERDGSGELTWRSAGRVIRLSDAKCGGTLLHVDPARELALVACSATGIRAPVLLVGPNSSQKLPIEVPASRVDHVQSRAPRLVPLYPGARTVVVDLDQRRTVELQPGDGVLAVHEGRALVRNATELAIVDTASGKRWGLADDLPDFGQILVSEPFVYAEPYIVDLAKSTIIGRTWGPIVAIASTGAYLVTSTPESPTSVAQGPLYWIQVDSSARATSTHYQVTASTKIGPSNGI